MLLLIRHAESANNRVAATGVGRRDPDPGLTALGERQASRLADAIATGGLYPRPDALVTSLMRRTIETAAPLADALDLPIHAQIDTHEIGGPYEGAWSEQRSHAGSSRSLLSGLSRRVVLPEQATEAGWYRSGFEAEEGWRERSIAVWRRLATTHADQTVALISHGAFSSHLLREALGSRARFSLVNTGSALVQVAADGPRLAWFNRFDHLSPEEVTGGPLA